MDSFATIAVAALAGFIPSVLVAILTNGTLFILGRLKLIFILCQIMTATGSWIVFKIARKRSQEKLSLDSFMLSGVISSFTNGIFGSLFAAMYHYNLTAIEQGIFLVTGKVLFANLTGGFFLNLVDKALASFTAYGMYLAVKHINNRKTGEGLSIPEATETPEVKIKAEYIFFGAALLTLLFSFSFKTMTRSCFDDVYDQISAPVNGYENIRADEKFISDGFDTLSYSSFILMAISLFIMQVRLTRRKNEIDILKAKEETQKTFSHDLHDGTIQSLSALKICISGGETENALVIANQAICETRELLGLARMDLSDNFKTLVEQYAKVFEENYKIKVSVYEASDSINSLNSNARYQLLKILQESLRNAFRHGNATQITVRMIDASKDFIFSISDNGSGFDPSILHNNISHAGTNIMKERAEFLGGTIKIQSDENGATVSVMLPIKNRRN